MTESPLAASIARLMISTEIPPGSHVTAAGLAERLHVSRTPVREAIRELAALGLVVVHDNRGAFVVDPDDIPTAEMIDLLATRRRLEPWVLSLAAERRTDDDLTLIADALAAGERAMAAGDAGALNLAHHALLRSLTSAGHNEAADIALAPLHYRTCLVFARVAPLVLPSGWPQHAAIAQAIRSADGDTAHDLHRRHLDEIIASLEAGDDAEGEPDGHPR
ncbi:MAG: GntR family transcriptional regulator [Actinomycetota bacterium]